eukprot:5057646-Prymnesium_polylepis.1
MPAALAPPHHPRRHRRRALCPPRLHPPPPRSHSRKLIELDRQGRGLERGQRVTTGSRQREVEGRGHGGAHVGVASCGRARGARNAEDGNGAANRLVGWHPAAEVLREEVAPQVGELHRDFLRRRLLRIGEDEVPHDDAVLEAVGSEELALFGLELGPQPGALQSALENDHRQMTCPPA